MRISIIGCGWLGLSLGKNLVENNFVVKGSTTREEKLKEIEGAGIEAFQIKVEDRIIGENTDHFFDTDILFLNIPPGRRRTDVAEAYPKEIKLVLDAAHKSGVKKVILASSTGVYANTGSTVTEDNDPQPSTQSGKALQKAEESLKQYSDMKYLILRFAGLVGGERKAGKWFAGKKGVPNGLARVNMVHREDCIAIVKALIEKDRWNTIFNVVADEHPTRIDFYKAQCLKDGFDPPSFLNESDGQFKVVSNQKIKSFLNYKLSHPDPCNF